MLDQNLKYIEVQVRLQRVESDCQTCCHDLSALINALIRRAPAAYETYDRVRL